MSHKINALLISAVFLLLPTEVESRETIASKTFQDWQVLVTQDEWGDQREIKLSTQNLVISINAEYGWVRQNYNFQKHRNYWPHCEVVNITYRVDEEKPVRTHMGGDAAQSATCASIRMPKEMLTDMKRGSVMEVRSGYKDTEKLKVSLMGFSKAWDMAQDHKN